MYFLEMSVQGIQIVADPCMRVHSSLVIHPITALNQFFVRMVEMKMVQGKHSQGGVFLLSLPIETVMLHLAQ